MQPASGSTDPDGIVRTKAGRGGPSRFLLSSACALLAVAAAALWLWRGGPPPGPSQSPAAAPSSGHSAGSAPSRPRPSSAPAQPAPAAAPAPDSTGEDDADAVPAAPSAEAAHEGINAFPAPGTKRIKVGIVVPEGFELPAGYARHYQTTDKGEMLPAILTYNMLNPPLDAQGRPVDLPEDGIVPADRAPPGLPVEMLHVPDNAYADPHEPPPPGAAGDDSDP